MVEIDAKDVILLLGGAIIALPITAGWQSTKDWIARRGQQASEFERQWQERLHNPELSVQQKATREIFARAFHNFVLGSIMMSAMGLGQAAASYVLGPVTEESIALQYYVNAGFCFASLVYFSTSMRWLRRFFRSR